MKKILIVGAGFGQFPAIVESKKLGLQVITIDKNSQAPGMKIADFSYAIDTLDVEKAIEIAKKHAVSGVFTMQTDISVPTVGAINDALNLRGVNLRVAQICSNKIETRQELQRYGISQPSFKVIEILNDVYSNLDEFNYPFVLKAPDSSGSRGVVKVLREENIRPAFEEAMKYSRQGKILMEEFIEGLEVGAQAFSINGKCQIVLVHNDTLSPPPYMVPLGHSFPFKLDRKVEKVIIDSVSSAVNALGIKNGPSNIDLIVDDSNIPKIIEIGARIGATCLPELVEFHTGINWTREAIKSCLGMEVNLIVRKKQPVAAVILAANEDGIFIRVEGEEKIRDHQSLLEYEITVTKGEIVNQLRKGTDRIGKIVVEGNSAKEAEDLAFNLKKKIKFEVKPTQ